MTVVVLGGLGRAPVCAQPESGGDRLQGGTEAAADSSRPVVRRVKIQGNEHFSGGTLKKQLRTSANRRVLSIPGFTWWRWIYQLGSADWMWERVGQALRKGGERPAYLDSSTVRGDVERLGLFYQQEGFRDADVSSSVRVNERGTRATVTFRVEPGPPTYLRRVSYEGLDELTLDQQRALAEETVLKADRRTADPPLSFRVKNQHFQRPLLLEERRRVLSFLQNEGYAAVSRDSVRALVYENRAPPGSLDVTFRVQPGPKYRFGDVRFQIRGPESASPRRDTLDVPIDETGRGILAVTSTIEDEKRLGTRLLARSLQFVPGTTYRRSRVLSTKQRLEGAGVFTLTSLTPQFDKVTEADSSLYLPLLVEGRTRQRHRLRMEAFGLQRVGVNFGSSEFGVGLGGVYENVNALGNGETFQLRMSGSVATSLDSTLITSRQLEGTASLTLPYLIRPFGGFERVFDLSNAKTEMSVSALTARRNDLRLRIRSRSNARLRLDMNHTPTRTSLVDVMDLSVSNPDTLSGFRERFLDSLFVRIEDPVQQAQILEDYTQPQINTALRYTFQSNTVNQLQRRDGHIYELSGEVGNTIPFLLDRFVFGPDSLQYSVPGLTGVTQGGGGGRLVYRPYVRGTIDLRRYIPLSRRSILAMKVFGGAAHPTGRPALVPFDRRFFSGGGTSVRGWRLRELGPGGAGQRIDFLGGDIKLESSVEVRTAFLRNVLAASWVGAAFLDVGNVWFGPRNKSISQGALGDGGQSGRSGSVDQSGTFGGLKSLADVGVGGGGGVRIEWPYLVVRFDLAYRLHDPSPANDDVFADEFGGPLLHFGIGQSF